MILRKVAAFLLAVSLPITVTAAQNDNIDKSINKPGKKNCLWKLSGKAGENGFVLGTMYLGKKEFFPLPAPIQKAFQKTQVILVEVNLSSENMLKNYKLVNDKAMFKGKETLKSSLSPELYKRFAKRLLEKNMDIENFKKVRPWMASQYVYGMTLAELGYKREYGIDNYLLNRAGNRRVISLLTLEYHLDVFDQFSKDVQESFLSDLLEPDDQIKTNIEGLMNAWLNGDIDYMEQKFVEMREKSPELREALLKIRTDRNNIMIKKIQLHLKTGKPTMLLIGAGQLPGDNGLLKLLESKGYSLKQL